MAKHATQSKKRRICYVIVDSRRASEQDTLGIQWAFTARQALFIKVMKTIGYSMDDAFTRFEAIRKMEWDSRKSASQPSEEELQLMYEMRSDAQPSPLSSHGCGCTPFAAQQPRGRRIRRLTVSRDQARFLFATTAAG